MSASPFRGSPGQSPEQRLFGGAWGPAMAINIRAGPPFRFSLIALTACSADARQQREGLFPALLARRQTMLVTIRRHYCKCTFSGSAPRAPHDYSSRKTAASARPCL